MQYGTELLIETDYSGIGKIQYILGQMGLEPVQAEYVEAVRLKLLSLNNS